MPLGGDLFNDRWISRATESYVSDMLGLWVIMVLVVVVHSSTAASCAVNCRRLGPVLHGETVVGGNGVDEGVHVRLWGIDT